MSHPDPTLTYDDQTIEKRMHTPTPWKISEQDTFSTVITSADDKTDIAECIEYDEKNTTIGQANAHFIVHSVNTRAILLNALQEIDAALRIPAAEYVPAISDVFKIIDEAIAKVEGKS